MIGTPLDELLLVEVHAVVGHEKRLHRFTRVWVRHAHHAHFGHARVLGQHLFHLGRVHVEPADDDEVLGPVDEVQVAIGVDRGDVARTQPPVGREHTGRECRFVPVAQEHVGALHPHFTRIAFQRVVARLVDQTHLHARQHASHRAVLHGHPGRTGDHGRRLGEAVTLGEHQAEPLLEAMHRLIGHACRTRECQTHPGETVGRRLGEHAERHPERRRTR